ncbi:MAG: hypothetical protein MK125_01450 [Dehalococcoidia bacterium]|nr:hypothetical protein [Dehalococcoidia bacterium]
MAAIDSFLAISDVSPNRGQLWRFLGTLSAQLVENNCPGLLWASTLFLGPLICRSLPWRMW